MMNRLSFPLISFCFATLLSASHECCGQEDFLKSQLKLVRAGEAAKSIEECTQRIAANSDDAMAYAVRAVIYATQFQPKKAAADLKKSKTLDAKNFLAACCRGYVLSEFGKVQEALEELKPFEDLIPKNAFALTVKAKIHMAENNIWESEKAIDQALKLSPSDPNVLEMKASCCDAQGARADAKKYLDQARALEPGATLLQLQELGEQIIDENYESVIRKLDELAIQKPELADLYVVRATAYFAYGLLGTDSITVNGRQITPEQAVEFGNRDACIGAALNPRDPSFLTILYELHMANGEFEEALAIAEKAIELWRFDSFEWLNRAEVHMAMGNTAAAKADFEQAQKCNPTDHFVLGEYAQFLTSVGDHPGAEKLLNRAIELRGEKIPYAFAQRGRCRVAQRNWKEAEKDFDMAVKLSPNNPSIYKNRANLWFQQKKWDLAEKEIARAIELNPNDSDAYRSRGSIRYEKKQWSNAEQDCTKAIQLDAENGLAFYYRGQSRVQQKRNDDAFKDFTRAIELQANLPQSLVARARISIQRKAFDSAEKDLVQAIKLNPGDQAAKELLAEARKLAGKS